RGLQPITVKIDEHGQSSWTRWPRVGQYVKCGAFSVRGTALAKNKSPCLSARAFLHSHPVKTFDERQGEGAQQIETKHRSRLASDRSEPFDIRSRPDRETSGANRRRHSHSPCTDSQAALSPPMPNSDSSWFWLVPSASCFTIPPIDVQKASNAGPAG